MSQPRLSQSVSHKQEDTQKFLLYPKDNISMRKKNNDNHKYVFNLVVVLERCTACDDNIIRKVAI